MVRASTRSKTTASLSAARAKAVSASTKTKTVTNVDDAVIQSPGRGKPKSKSKPTPPKPNSLKATTEHSTQITIDGDEEDKENVNHLVEEDIEGGDVEGGVESDPVKGEVEEDQSRSKPVEVMLKESDAPVWCLCRGVDDGSPMIKCEGCDGWYHFHCISLIDTDAEEIAEYFCSDCQHTSGKTTRFTWEITDDDLKESPVDTKKPLNRKVQVQTPPPMNEHQLEEDDEDDGSSDGDDYVDEERLAKRNKRTASSRIQAVPTSGTDDDETPEPEVKTRRRRPSSRLIESGTTTSFLKRKSGPTSPSGNKRVKTEKPAPVAADDPIRKYCLGKLKEVILPIFRQYLTPPVPAPTSPPPAEATEANEDTLFVDAGKDVVAVDETEIEAKATAFVDELEQCVFTYFSEPDRKGNKSAGPKYKERFRMLTFNLEKEDRVILRKSIAEAEISPDELSQMSSTDLANEQTKQEIESAREQSMKHSILEVRLAPRAKITHKGEEMIDLENVGGENRARAIEFDREEEDREARAQRARERERELIEAEKEAAAAAAAEGEDQPNENDERMELSDDLAHNEHDLGSASATGFDITEVLGDMGLPSSATSTSSPFKLPHLTIPPPTPGPPSNATPRSSSFSSTSNPVLASALLSASQFAPSFDLGSVWGGQHPQPAGHPREEAESPDEYSVDDGGLDGLKLEGPGHTMADNDFDMFFDKGGLFEGPTEEPSITTPVEVVSAEAEEAAYLALPVVWDGDVQLPIDAASAWTSRVSARQIGGRGLGHNTAIWRQLFTLPVTRIDGRVPVDKSTEYLVRTRLNATKELIAVAFAPVSAEDADEMTRLQNFLLDKGRHGLVFPWARIPPDQAVGKDFYLVPLKPEDPTPEYIELLDDVHLPKRRTTTMMLGIFVLHKGRLAAAAAAAATPTPPLSVSHLPSIPPVVTPPVLPNLEALSALLPKGGLTEQHKHLLQNLLANGGISAFAGVASSSSQPPVMPPQPPFNAPPAPYIAPPPAYPPFHPQHYPPSGPPAHPAYPLDHPQGPDPHYYGGRDPQSPSYGHGRRQSSDDYEYDRDRGGRGRRPYDRRDSGDRQRDAGWGHRGFRGGRGSSRRGW